VEGRQLPNQLLPEGGGESAMKMMMRRMKRRMRRMRAELTVWTVDPMRRFVARETLQRGNFAHGEGNISVVVSVSVSIWIYTVC